MPQRPCNCKRQQHTTERGPGSGPEVQSKHAGAAAGAGGTGVTGGETGAGAGAEGTVVVTGAEAAKTAEVVIGGGIAAVIVEADESGFVEKVRCSLNDSPGACLLNTKT